MRISRLLSLVPTFGALTLTFALIACSQNPSSAQPPVAANAAGTWTWTYDGGGADQAITHTYTLKQNGEALTGTFKDTYDETAVDIKDGKVRDGQVSFTVVRPLMDNNMTFTFTGKLEGNTITGKASWTMMDQPTTADWLAKRGS